MRQCKVVSGIVRSGGQRFRTGSVVELNESEAKRLAGLGVVSIIAGDGKDKPKKQKSNYKPKVQVKNA